MGFEPMKIEKDLLALQTSALPLCHPCVSRGKCGIFKYFGVFEGYDRERLTAIQAGAVGRRPPHQFGAAAAIPPKIILMIPKRNYS